MRRTLIVSAMFALAATGCSSMMGSMMGSAGSSAGNQVGTAAGNRAGAAAVNATGGPGAPATPNYAAGGAAAGGGGMGAMGGSPQAMSFYTQYIFSMAFGSGGYAINPIDYKAGQYTRWNVAASDGNGSVLERAFLFADADGNQWWKVKFTSSKGDTIILEALLSPKDQRMLRLRGKFPQDEAGKEMAVAENAYYQAPQRLSKQSVDGAVVGTDSVVVPAGTFAGRHVVFGDIGTSHEWWLNDGVPGGTVKQLTKGASANSRNHGYEMDLVAFGTDAVSELGSK